MQDSQTTVSIGIPAYNERQTIATILTALRTQTQTNFIIKEIIVVSDASTDGTETEINKTAHPLVTLLRNNVRRGVAHTINRIAQAATGDMLVILNADIAIKDNELLDKLLKPLIKDTADIVAGNIQNTPPKGFIETIFSKSCEVKQALYRKMNNGNNMFTCHGPLRGSTKEFYKSLHLVEDIADDMYTYYYANVHGYRYAYVPNATVYYKLPTTIAEHIKQSNRFFTSLQNAHEYFGDNFPRPSQEEERLPLQFMIRFLYQYPFYFLMYLCIQSVVFFQTIFGRTQFKQQWDIINSSKQLYES